MTRPAGRHRTTGRHRKPVQRRQMSPAARKRAFRVVCGCAACAVVIPLFLQSGPDPKAAPDLVSVQTPPAPTVAMPVLAPVPPVFTIQPRADVVTMVSEATGEMSKHHDKSDRKDDTSSSDESSSSSSSDDSSDSTDKHHQHHPSGDSESATPPPACR